MSNAPKDDNRKPAAQGVSKIDGTTPTTIKVKASTGAIIVEVA